MNEHTFTVFGGEEVIKGKVTYPDYIAIDLPPSEAWYLLETLISQLQRVSKGDKDIVSLNFLGSLIED